jgi:outer membrane receptor protein involved in Fe transport
VEILKGAAGSLYGSGAVGGVVNIITKRATRRLY